MIFYGLWFVRVILYKLSYLFKYSEYTFCKVLTEQISNAKIFEFC